MALEKEELSAIEDSIGRTSTILASGIARLHLASPDPSNYNPEPDSVLRQFQLTEKSWTYSGVVGGLALVINRENSSIAFQIYDLTTMELQFEYELYENIDYQKLNAQFHTFEMQDCVAGFCFADARVGNHFWGKVNKSRPTYKELSKKKKKKLFKGFRKSRRADSDLEIGAVIGVEHKGHMGLDASGGFDINNIPAEWKAMFRKAGIRKADLKDEETAKQLITTIQNHEMNEMYLAQPEYQSYTADQLEAMYTPEHRAQYTKYQEELRQYQKKMDQQEHEAEMLSAWEQHNVQNTPKLPPRKKKKAEPPVPPPRKRNSPGKKITQFDRELATQAKLQIEREAEKLAKQAEEEERIAAEKARKAEEELKRKRAQEEKKRKEEEKKAAAMKKQREREAAERKVQEEKDAAARRYEMELQQVRKEAEEAKEAAKIAALEREEIMKKMAELENTKTVNNMEDILDEAKYHLEVVKYEIEKEEEPAPPPPPPPPALPDLPALPTLPQLPPPPVPKAPKLKAPAIPDLPAAPKKKAPALPKVPAVPAVPAVPSVPSLPVSPAKAPPKKKKEEPKKEPKKEKKPEIQKKPSKKASHAPFLKGIAAGKVELKPTPKPKEEPKTIKPPPNLIMDAIKNGVALKKTVVPSKKKKKSVANDNKTNALIAKLAETIRVRVGADDDDDDSDEDDWSDDEF